MSCLREALGHGSVPWRWRRTAVPTRVRRRLAATGGTEPGQLRVAAASWTTQQQNTLTYEQHSAPRGPPEAASHGVRASRPLGLDARTPWRALRAATASCTARRRVPNTYGFGPMRCGFAATLFVQGPGQVAKSPPTKSRNQSNSLSFQCFEKCENPEYQPAIEKPHVIKKAHSYEDLRHIGFHPIHVITQYTLPIVSICRWL
jgi:hypothetical protein